VDEERVSSDARSSMVFSKAGASNNVGHAFTLGMAGGP